MSTIALFGEAERGLFRMGFLCRSLMDLEQQVGQPPSESGGLYFAVQAILYNHNVIFFRVEEEGFSLSDYLGGLEKLKQKELYPEIAAIAAPGAASLELVEPITAVCHERGSVFIVHEADFYDFISDQRSSIQ